MSNYNLIVHNPFGTYAKGALITDSAEVQRILTSENRSHVHRILPIAPTEPLVVDKPETQG